jgi:hypothetical protein
MPPAKKVRVMTTLEGPLHKRLMAQCQERGYSQSVMVAKAVDAYLTHLEHVPTIDEQILRYVNEIRVGKEGDG